MICETLAIFIVSAMAGYIIEEYWQPFTRTRRRVQRWRHQR